MPTSSRQTLRFLKTENIKNIKQVYNNLYSDFINAYGVDVIYTRREQTFFEKDEDKKTACPIYGQDPTAKYTAQGRFPIFMEMLADSYLLNRFGIQSEMEIQAYIGITDFVECFKNILGKKISKTYNVSLSAKIGDKTISGIIDTPELYGKVEGVLPVQYDVTVKRLILTDLDFVVLPRPKNLIYKDSLDYELSSATSSKFYGDLIIDYEKGMITGTATGSISHNQNFAENQVSDYKISPQPGDLIQLELEEGDGDIYEVTRVIDRRYAQTAFSPLFEKTCYILSLIKHQDSYEKTEIKPENIYNPPQEFVETITETPKEEKKQDVSENQDEIQDYADAVAEGTEGIENNDAYGGY